MARDPYYGLFFLKFFFWSRPRQAGAHPCIDPPLWQAKHTRKGRNRTFLEFKTEVQYYSVTSTVVRYSEWSRRLSAFFSLFQPCRCLEPCAKLVHASRGVRGGGGGDAPPPLWQQMHYCCPTPPPPPRRPSVMATTAFLLPNHSLSRHLDEQEFIPLNGDSMDTSSESLTLLRDCSWLACVASLSLAMFFDRKPRNQEPRAHVGRGPLHPTQSATSFP